MLSLAGEPHKRSNVHFISLEYGEEFIGEWESILTQLSVMYILGWKGVYYICIQLMFVGGRMNFGVKKLFFLLFLFLFFCLFVHISFFSSLRLA